jgi:hypothetical protein
MSRLTMLTLALALALSTVSVSFADDNNQKGPVKAVPNKTQPPPPPPKKKKPLNPNKPPFKGKTKEPKVQ